MWSILTIITFRTLILQVHAEELARHREARNSIVDGLADKTANYLFEIALKPLGLEPMKQPLMPQPTQPPMPSRLRHATRPLDPKVFEDVKNVNNRFVQTFKVGEYKDNAFRPLPEQMSPPLNPGVKLQFTDANGKIVANEDVSRRIWYSKGPEGAGDEGTLDTALGRTNYLRRVAPDGARRAQSKDYNNLKRLTAEDILADKAKKTPMPRNTAMRNRVLGRRLTGTPLFMWLLGMFGIRLPQEANAREGEFADGPDGLRFKDTDVGDGPPVRVDEVIKANFVITGWHRGLSG